MTLTTTIARLAVAALALAQAGCALAEMSAESEYARLPRDVRTGIAEMAIERVEQDVSREEVTAAVQTLVEAEPMCFSWPGLWLDASNRRNFYFVRYDLMARDWGAEVADAGRARMNEFVELGFLVARERPDIAPGVIEYTLTTDGVAYLRGSPYGGERPSFCAPSQRRVVEITSMEWGTYPCGTLLVRFNHVADDWPTWARTPTARNRVASTWAPVGVPAAGSVSLSRQWFHPSRIPSDGRANGALRSVCYDSARQVVSGDDLELGAEQP